MPENTQVQDDAASGDFAPSPELKTFAALAEAKQPKNLAELRKVLEEAEAAAANPTFTGADLEEVRVYNRARKQFRHGDYLAAPSSFVTLPRWLAVKWMAMFQDDIISGDDALKTVDASAAEAAALKQKNDDLNAEKAALAKELAETKAALAKANGGGLS